MMAQSRPGMVSLVTDALGRSANLVQTEIRLARAELSEKAETVRDNLVASLALMLLGCVFLIAAVGLVLQALVAALIEGGLAAHWAILIVAGGAAAGGIVVFLAGKNLLGKVDPTPERTIESLQRDAHMAKESLS